MNSKKYKIITFILVAITAILLCISVCFQFSFIKKYKVEYKVDLSEYFHIDQDTLEQIFNSDGSIKQ